MNSSEAIYFKIKMNVYKNLINNYYKIEYLLDSELFLDPYRINNYWDYC